VSALAPPPGVMAAPAVPVVASRAVAASAVAERTTEDRRTRVLALVVGQWARSWPPTLLPRLIIGAPLGSV
jgi:hypothetical protein